MLRVFIAANKYLREQLKGGKIYFWPMVSEGSDHDCLVHHGHVICGGGVPLPHDTERKTWETGIAFKVMPQ
jgi:hypothetical protein